jgi:hypothetical protein
MNGKTLTTKVTKEHEENRFCKIPLCAFVSFVVKFFELDLQHNRYAG